MSMIIDAEALGLKVGNYSGDEAVVICPFHDDHHPSASINLVTGLFHCFTCGANSNADLIAAWLGGEVVYISDNKVRRGTQGEDERDWQSLLLSPLAYDNDYLVSRKVGNDLVEKFEIKQTDDGIVFPMKNRQGIFCGLQMRNYKKQPKYVFYGQRPELWPFENLIKNSKRITFITEGVFGVLSAETAGVNSVAILGANSFRKAIPFLQSFKGLVNGRSKIITAFDADNPGVTAAGKMAVLGFPALIPFITADETPPMEWWTVLYDYPNNITTNLEKIAAFAPNKQSFWSNIKNFRRNLNGYYSM